MFEILLLLLSAYSVPDSGSVHLEGSKIFTLDINNETYSVPISVIPGNITEVKSPTTGHLLIHMNPTANGTLVANVPRSLIETTNMGYGLLSVLKNGQKTDYVENGLSCDYRSVKVQFDQNTHEIAISGIVNDSINWNNGTGLYSSFQIGGISIDMNSDQKICNYGSVFSGGFYIDVANDTKTHHMKISFPQTFLKSPFVYVTHNKKIDFSDTQYNEKHIISFNYSNTSEIQITTLKTILLPLQQFQSGINGKDVQCRDGFQLILKVENGHPTCVKPTTSNILIERGWAKPV
ncbi:MAG TPA: hypothetical protein VFW99_04370 [Candidatus Nitrosotalea sp.]|nr:hypothetical protein [Candidatus Nitrosotalea sp.]